MLPKEPRLKIIGDAGAEAVYVNDVLMPYGAISLKLRYGQVPIAIIELPVISIDTDLSFTDVVLDQMTQAALVALGWTPPA